MMDDVFLSTVTPRWGRVTADRRMILAAQPNDYTRMLFACPSYVESVWDAYRDRASGVYILGKWATPQCVLVCVTA